jgi:bifunctional non-homologous end joining protein LigD
MELDGQDVRPEPLEERRKRLRKLLSRSNKAMRDGIRLSEALTGYGGHLPPCLWAGARRHCSKRLGSRYVRGRMRAWLKRRILGLRRPRFTEEIALVGASAAPSKSKSHEDCPTKDPNNPDAS